MCWFLSFRRRSSSFPRIDTKEFVCVWERAIYFYDGNGTGSCVVFLFVAACRKSTAPLLQRGSRPWPESPLFFVIVLVSTRFYIFIYLLQRQSLASEGIRSSLAGRRWKTGRAARRAAAAISWESLLQSFFLHFHDRHTFRNSFPPNSWRAAGTNKPSNIFFIIQVAHIPLEHLLIPPMQFPQEVFFFFQRIFLEALALPLDNLFDEYKCTIVCFLCCCRDLWASLSGGKRPRWHLTRWFHPSTHHMRLLYGCINSLRSGTNQRIKKGGNNGSMEHISRVVVCPADWNETTLVWKGDESPGIFVNAGYTQ